MCKINYIFLLHKYKQIKQVYNYYLKKIKKKCSLLNYSRIYCNNLDFFKNMEK